MEVYAVVKKQRKPRRGKGFSRKELKEVSLSSKQALKLGISFDPRRSTKYKENVKALNEYLSGELSSLEIHLDLTNIKSIGQKRYEALKTMGIDTIKKLAESDSEEVADKLAVSKTRAYRWIEDAKKLLKE